MWLPYSLSYVDVGGKRLSATGGRYIISPNFLGSHTLEQTKIERRGTFRSELSLPSYILRWAEESRLTLHTRRFCVANPCTAAVLLCERKVAILGAVHPVGSHQIHKNCWLKHEKIQEKSVIA